MDDRPHLVAVPPGTASPVVGVDAGWLGTRPRPVLTAMACTVVALGAGMLAPSHLKYAIALIGLAAAVGAVLLRPLVGALLLVGLVPITSGLATGFPVQHVRLSEAVIGVVGITLLGSARRTHAVAWGPVDWLLLLYGVGWAVFAAYGDFSLGQHLTVTQWGTSIGQLQFFLVYRGVRVGVRSVDERRLAVGVLLASSALVSLLAVLQKLNAPMVRSLIVKMTGGTTGGTPASAVGHTMRATGPFANWAALAGYLLPILLVLVALALARQDARHRRWFIGVGVLGAAAMALADEQSAIVCLAVGVVVLVRQYGRGRTVWRWAPLIVVVVAVLAGPSIAHRIVNELSPSAGTGRVSWVPQTLSFRWSVWTQQYFPSIAQHPITGYGVVLPDTIRWPWPESEYVSFLMEGGFPMLVLFGAMAWGMLRGTADAARAVDPFEQALGRALTIAVVSMIVMSSIWPFLSNGGMPQVLWALLALAVPRRPPLRSHPSRTVAGVAHVQPPEPGVAVLLPT
ncbi:MAG: O-antigen ligase family protein [Acidimicrobiales bacterium]